MTDLYMSITDPDSFREANPDLQIVAAFEFEQGDWEEELLEDYLVGGCLTRPEGWEIIYPVELAIGRWAKILLPHLVQRSVSVVVFHVK